MGEKLPVNVFVARAGVKRQIEGAREWLLLTELPRETVYTICMKMQELADAALRQAVERQAAETSAQKQARETEPAP